MYKWLIDWEIDKWLIDSSRTNRKLLKRSWMLKISKVCFLQACKPEHLVVWLRPKQSLRIWKWSGRRDWCHTSQINSEILRTRNSNDQGDYPCTNETEWITSLPAFFFFRSGRREDEQLHSLMWIVLTFLTLATQMWISGNSLRDKSNFASCPASP